MPKVETEIKEALDQANTVLIIQAENPDGDSLASSLALEKFLHDLGKDPIMFCPVNMPRHLRYLSGWDRVTDELPNQFDVSIIVDTSAATLLEKVLNPENTKKLSSKPCIVIDHHTNEMDLPFEAIAYLSSDAVATGEMIYDLSQELEWPTSVEAYEHLATSIMFDSIGLVSEGVTPHTMEVMTELVKSGVSLSKLDNKRRELMKRSSELTTYKGELLSRIEYFVEGQVALVIIPWEEIEQYSDAYNPPMLVMDDMRMTEGVKIAAAFKLYKDDTITGKMRTNPDGSVADKIAERLGGGGHPYAAGFKVKNAKLEAVQKEFLSICREELEKYETA